MIVRKSPFTNSFPSLSKIFVDYLTQLSSHDMWRGAENILEQMLNVKIIWS